MLLAFIILCSLLLLAGFGTGLYFYCLALSRSFTKNAALRSLPPKEKSGVPKREKENFFVSCGAQSAEQLSFDGLKLHAFYKENSGDWIIIQHGYMNKATSMANTARSFYEQGYSILVPDARGHGQSEGHYIGMGWHDRKDLMGWIDFILRKDPSAKIVLYGISMGGAAVMMLAGENLAPNVKGIVEDCGYSSIWEELYYQLNTLFKLPRPFALFTLFFADILTRLFASYSLHEGNCLKALQKASVPMLFLHGDRDNFVPVCMVDQVFEAAACKDKTMLVFPGAEHGRAAHSDPEKYKQAVLSFVKRVFS